jgi:serine/threonine-protein kinase RsbW
MAVRLDAEVCLPREVGSISLVRTAVTAILGAFGVEQDCLEDIRLAVSEACANVVAHATSDDRYQVQVHVDEHTCAIDVRNSASWFDASSLEGVMPGPGSARGRGVAIIRAVMDNVALESGPQSGTIVHLVRALSFRPGGPLSRVRQEG